ncbi:MAG TPA: cob(I)yrinic acid a,c-diamide adenosyltransferase, partial [Desulfurella acetivorans]|nr:cob(I)yrinic acid a,c-diamide adenosyltransferase [Desulfurella acetivorans]
FGLFSDDELIELIDKKPQNTELIITGRYATQKVIDRADLVTEMKEIKHYYTQGVIARDGIEK